MNNQQSKTTRVQGKLPCGNPRRYRGRDVVRMSNEALAGSKRKASSSLVADDGTKTEAELHLHRLLQKQMKTDVTLSGHFHEHRSFSEATEHRPGVDELVGVHGYQEYKLTSDLDSKIDFLRHCGLNDEEITLKLRQDMASEGPAKASGFSAEPESQVKKLEEIERKIQEKERQLKLPYSTKGALLLTRQEMELEASHRQRFGATEDIKNQQNVASALTMKSTQIEPKATHPDDPINHIPKFLSSLEGKNEEREPRRDRRRRRKFEQRLQYYEQFEEENPSTSTFLEVGSHSDTDIDDTVKSRLSGAEADSHHEADKASVEVEQLLSSNTGNQAEEDRGASSNERGEELVEATCAPRPSDWISAKAKKPKRKRAGKPAPEEVELRSGVKFLSKGQIYWNKFDVTEIRMMSKFRHYTPGTPNRVLYLKNLTRSTKVEHLMEVFGCLQKEGQPKITFKMMTGQMKGQAFVTMQDEKAATEALVLINGYILLGAPLIVSFAKDLAEASRSGTKPEIQVQELVEIERKITRKKIQLKSHRSTSSAAPLHQPGEMHQGASDSPETELEAICLDDLLSGIPSFNCWLMGESEETKPREKRTQERKPKESMPHCKQSEEGNISATTTTLEAGSHNDTRVDNLLKFRLSGSTDEIHYGAHGSSLEEKQLSNNTNNKATENGVASSNKSGEQLF